MRRAARPAAIALAPIASALALALALAAPGPGAAQDAPAADAAPGDPFLERAPVRDWLDELAEGRGLDRDRLAGAFAALAPDASVLELISRPAERTLGWADYAAIFLTDERVAAGRDWMAEHRETLDALAADVDPATVAAIVGVETYFGRIVGERSVLRSLATLGFDYPPRADFFRAELGEYLALALDEGWDLADVTGSYAGAMGLPQFIPSSYRAYAVDGDGDGRIDLFGSVPDVVASVDAYLERHGWRAGAPVAEPWEDPPEAAFALAESGRLRPPALEPATLREAGFGSARLDAAEAAGEAVTVMRFDAWDGPGALGGDGPGAAGERLLVCYNNFYAITRYNHSRLYARAVHELARALDAP